MLKKSILLNYIIIENNYIEHIFDLDALFI